MLGQITVMKFIGTNCNLISHLFKEKGCMAKGKSNVMHELTLFFALCHAAFLPIKRPCLDLYL